MVCTRLDSNRDGREYRWSEYKAAARTLLGKEAKDPELVKAFQVADSDGDGSIDFKEFMEMQNVGGGIKSSDIEGAFHMYDLDGNDNRSKRLLYHCMLEV